jgi:hypothetical protein
VVRPLIYREGVDNKLRTFRQNKNLLTVVRHRLSILCYLPLFYSLQKYAWFLSHTVVHYRIFQMLSYVLGVRNELYSTPPQYKKTTFKVNQSNKTSSLKQNLKESFIHPQFLPSACRRVIIIMSFD